MAKDTFRKAYRPLTPCEDADKLTIKTAAEEMEAILAKYPSREASLALTNLQQAVFWSSMAITATRA